MTSSRVVRTCSMGTSQLTLSLLAGFGGNHGSISISRQHECRWNHSGTDYQLPDWFLRCNAFREGCGGYHGRNDGPGSFFVFFGVVLLVFGAGPCDHHGSQCPDCKVQHVGPHSSELTCTLSPNISTKYSGAILWSWWILGRDGESLNSGKPSVMH